MKKYIGLTVLSLSVIALFSFVYFESAAPKDAEFNLDTFMQEKVYKEIGVLTGYNPKKSFSRCPSGFSFNESEKSSDAVAYGTIYNAEGCHMEPFCQFKIIKADKKTFLKKTQNEPFIAMSDFVKVQMESDPAKF